MKKLFLAVLVISVSISLRAQQVMTFSNPEVIPMNLVRVTPPLRDLPQSPVEESFSNPRVEHENPTLEHQYQQVNPDALPHGTDPALQTNYANGYEDFTTATILSNWEGLTANVDPSDNTIAVGPNHVVQMTNNNVSTYIRIWDKAGNILVNNMKMSTISGISDFGDPNLIYDPGAKRWVMLALYSFSANKLEVLVSQTSDPTGSYYVYSFTTTGGFPDYPKIGIWGNSYFITTNSNSPTIFALKRNSMLNGSGTGSVQKFSLAGFPSIGFEAPSPITFTGTTNPPAGERAMVIRVADDAWGGSVGSDHLEIYNLKINWNNPANSTITGPISLPIDAFNSNLCGFNSLSCIPQPGTSTKLDPLGNIVMDKVQYRNLGSYEAIVCSHVCNVDGNGTAGVRWYELRKVGNGSWFIYQQGTYSPSNDGRFMSSISINQSGQIALGYNISSGTVYPGIRITGRDTCDALNTMAVPETLVKEGSSKNGSNRYGDYNAMVTDPSDGSFWFTGNYNVTTDWTTSVVHFTFDQCPLRLASAESAINELSAVPNPASDEVTVSFVSAVEEEVPLRIVDMNGKLVLEKMQNVSKGYNSTTINVSNLQSGYYLVKVLAPEGTAFRKLVIQR